MNRVPADAASRRDIRTGRKTFVATVVAVYLAMFAFLWPSLSLAEMVGLSIVGGAYLLVGLYGAEFFIRTGSAIALVAFYAFEIPLAGLIVYWTAGFFLAGLIILPLAGLAVQVLPRRWIWAVCVLLVVALSTAYGLGGGLEAALLAGIGYLAAIVFVVSATQVAVREREARAEVERLADELQEANRKLQAYAAQAEELAVARERARLAHEIHDTVGHTLTALDVQLELLARSLPGQTERWREIAMQARSLAKEGLADMRRAVAALRPLALESFSLPVAIDGLVTHFTHATGIRTEWRVEGEQRNLALRTALPLYRAVQEALTNIQRHAASTPQVTIQLRYEPDAVTLTVVNARSTQGDDHVSEEVRNGGHGLAGLRERAAMLGGRFEVGPDEADGFRLEMSLPE